jgi:hypothetical protein
MLFEHGYTLLPVHASQQLVREQQLVRHQDYGLVFLTYEVLRLVYTHENSYLLIDRPVTRLISRSAPTGPLASPRP